MLFFKGNKNSQNNPIDLNGYWQIEDYKYYKGFLQNC
jgi:hypothetical protein